MADRNGNSISSERRKKQLRFYHETFFRAFFNEFLKELLLPHHIHIQHLNIEMWKKRAKIFKVTIFHSVSTLRIDLFLRQKPVADASHFCHLLL